MRFIASSNRAITLSTIRFWNSILSQEHGIRKVFGERRSRYLPAARAKGWHVHYDALPENHSFLKDAATLIRFDINHFYSNYLVQRLTGIGALLEQPVGARQG